MARIAIVGPGAVGATMAAWLGRWGRHEIVLCARRSLGDLTLETPDEILSIQASVVTNPSAAPPVDWILVTTKTYDAPGASTWFPALGARGAPIAILQNGVEHQERFEPYVPAARLLPVLVYCPAERASPTRIRQRRAAELIVPDGSYGRDFAALFAGTGVAVTLSPDFRSEAWRKLCLNAAGVMNALLLQPAGVFQHPMVAEAATAIMREGMEVGRAEGARLSDDLPTEVLARYASNPSDTINSLQADRLAGRPLEIEARNGVIVRLGRRHGIATPCNQMAVALLTALSIGAAPPRVGGGTRASETDATPAPKGYRSA